jgi:hypothetical protein
MTSPEAEAAAQLLAAYFADSDDEAAEDILTGSHRRADVDWYAVARAFAAVIATEVTDEERRDRLVRLMLKTDSA